MYNDDTIEKTLYAVFADGTYWGSWSADTPEAATQMAADEIGTNGDTEGFIAFEVTPDEREQVDRWWEEGADAATIPKCVEH